MQIGILYRNYSIIGWGGRALDCGSFAGSVAEVIPNGNYDTFMVDCTINVNVC